MNETQRALSLAVEAFSRFKDDSISDKEYFDLCKDASFACSKALELEHENQVVMNHYSVMYKNSKRYEWLRDNFHGFEMFRKSQIPYVTLDSEVDKAIRDGVKADQ